MTPARMGAEGRGPGRRSGQVMPFTIAIVGRPNVGKSTLFNRLAGKRLALVDPAPGLTRDRKEADVEIAGEPFRIVDTAGLEEAAEGSITARMREQTGKAIAAADLVLFVIDARAGVMPGDEVFAELVRISGRPVLVVANKCEGRGGEAGFYEAFSLGLGEPTAVSAEHNEGISDLQGDIFKRATAARGDTSNANADEAQDATGVPVDEAAAGDHRNRRLRIAVVGRPNAGKSTLVNTLIGEERMITGPEAGITRDAIAVDLDYEGRGLKLFDTAGLRRKARISEQVEQLAVSDTLRAIRFAEVVILLIDAERPFEHQDLQIGELVASEGRALVIGVNKWDKVVDKQKVLKGLRDEVARVLPQVKGVPVVPVSALSGAGVKPLLAAVFEMEAAWNRRVATNPLNRWLQEAVEVHQPPAASGRRIRLRYMTQPSTRPPTFVAFCSKPDSLPDSYVRYLVNSLRNTFQIPGVPIRVKLRKGDNPFRGKS